jgi:hypothetical protein
MLAPIALALLSSGCVTVVYQPLRSLHRPVVLDTDKPNFEGVRVQVNCPAGAAAKGGDAKLCRKVQRVFANQGAITVLGADPAAPKPDLVIDLQLRVLNDEVDRLFAVLCVLSATLLPWITDTSLAEDITIRDGDGFLLASDSFQARFVRYTGFLVWAVNGLIDLIIRPDEEDLTGTSQHPLISRDFYGQLSQLAFHAHTRALVLRGFERSK